MTMSASSMPRPRPVPYALPPDALEGLLRLAAHVALTETASLFVQQDGNVWPLALSGVSLDAAHEAALLLPDILDGADNELIVPDASLDREPLGLLVSVLAGEPGLLILRRFSVQGQDCHAVLLLAHPVPRQQMSDESMELVSEISRQIALRMEARLERKKLEAARESQASLHQHLEMLGSTLCLGHCIVNVRGGILSVGESLCASLRLSEAHMKGCHFEDLFAFGSPLHEHRGSGVPEIPWSRIHYTPCVHHPSEGAPVRMTASAIQIPYPGEDSAWSVVFLRVKEEPGVSGTPAQTILIAEDHPVNQRVIQGMVEKLGLRAEIVSNGLEAVHAVCQNTYAAILMDCQMPEMDGIEATRFIRGNEDSIGRIPIVAVTAFGQEDDRRRCLEAGVDEFMVKPIRMEALAEVLSRWTDATDGSLEDSVDEVSPSSQRMGDALDRLRADLDTDVVRDIVMLFLDDSRARLAHLAAVADERRWEEARALVHIVKGSSSSLGAADLVEACEAFEAESSENPEVLRRRIAEIEQRFEDVAPMLKRYLDNLPPG